MYGNIFTLEHMNRTLIPVQIPTYSVMDNFVGTLNTQAKQGYQKKLLVMSLSWPASVKRNIFDEAKNCGLGATQVVQFLDLI